MRLAMKSMFFVLSLLFVTFVSQGVTAEAYILEKKGEGKIWDNMTLRFFDEEKVTRDTVPCCLIVFRNISDKRLPLLDVLEARLRPKLKALGKMREESIIRKVEEVLVENYEHFLVIEARSIDVRFPRLGKGFSLLGSK